MAWGLAILLAVLVLLFTWKLPGAGKWRILAWVFLVILYAGLVIALLKAQLCHGELTRTGYARQSRLAFLASLGIGLVLTGLTWVVGRLGFAHSQVTASSVLISVLLSVSAAFLGSFSGGLIATGIADGLWEDNSPPSPGVQEWVIRKHAQVVPLLKPSPFSKRLLDILISGLGLVVTSPIWLASLLLIWLEDPGPVLFVKNSVGKGGKNFRQYKLRTMVRRAEEATGPVMAQEGDERVLMSGKFLRKTALDELPQLLNILLGEMSIVGPRPQRTVLVYEYLQEIPEYALRHQVLPGLAGLAQVAGDYYLTPRQKLRFDRLYIQHQSIGFDFRLLLAAFLITFWYRWKRDWDGRLPRRLLHG